MATELPAEEEDLHISYLRNAEEAANRRRAQSLPADDVDTASAVTSRPDTLPTDEVDMASAVKTDSVDKSENEQTEQANPGKEPTLDEAADIIKSGDANATTSENEGRTAAKEKTANNAGSPDGVADL